MRKLCNLEAFNRDSAVSLKVMSIAQYFFMRGYTHINVTLGLGSVDICVFLHSYEEAVKAQREMANMFELARRPKINDLSEPGKPLYTVQWYKNLECFDSYD